VEDEEISKDENLASDYLVFINANAAWFKKRANRFHGGYNALLMGYLNRVKCGATSDHVSSGWRELRGNILHR
jgi:hypothetical protein